MISLTIILHEDLPALVGGRREIRRRLPGAASRKDAIEALDIPHTEIGRVTADGRSAVVDGLAVDGERLEVWPTDPYELEDPRFLCDLHLGKLARLLRFCGFDTDWSRDGREAALALHAAHEGRVMLSRHRALLKRTTITRGLLIRADDVDSQLVEVLRRFRLSGAISRPGRCAACNGELLATAKDEVTVPIPPRTAAWLEEYWVCAGCGKLFWEGTHVGRMRGRVAAAVAACEPTS